jgi:hypothetical protein
MPRFWEAAFWQQQQAQGNLFQQQAAMQQQQVVVTPHHFWERAWWQQQYQQWQAPPVINPLLLQQQMMVQQQLAVQQQMAWQQQMMMAQQAAMYPPPMMQSGMMPSPGLMQFNMAQSGMNPPPGLANIDMSRSGMGMAGITQRPATTQNPVSQQQQQQQQMMHGTLLNPQAVHASIHARLDEQYGAEQVEQAWQAMHPPRGIASMNIGNWLGLATGGLLGFSLMGGGGMMTTILGTAIGAIGLSWVGGMINNEVTRLMQPSTPQVQVNPTGGQTPPQPGIEHEQPNPGLHGAPPAPFAGLHR